MAAQEEGAGTADPAEPCPGEAPGAQDGYCRPRRCGDRRGSSRRTAACPPARSWHRSGAFRFRLHLVPFEWLPRCWPWASACTTATPSAPRSSPVRGRRGDRAAVPSPVVLRPGRSARLGCAHCPVASPARRLRLVAPVAGAAVRLLGVRPGPLGACATPGAPRRPGIPSTYRLRHVEPSRRRAEVERSPRLPRGPARRRQALPHPARRHQDRHGQRPVRERERRRGLAQAHDRGLRRARPRGVTSEGYLTILRPRDPDEGPRVERRRHRPGHRDGRDRPLRGRLPGAHEVLHPRYGTRHVPASAALRAPARASC